MKGASRRGLLLFVETIIFTVIVPGAVVFWIPRDVLGIWGHTSLDSWSVRRVVALVPLTLGLAVYARCLWEFAARGRGIPAPLDHPKQLVVTGLYQYVRNPMYVGVMLFLLGEALFFGSPRFLLYAIAWLVFVHANVLLYEEPNLRRKFGISYEHYTSAVHRWIPGKRYRADFT
jgi:protein-S-isoprenylcysteine O-methyltransferase Ste14